MTQRTTIAFASLALSLCACAQVEPKPAPQQPQDAKTLIAEMLKSFEAEGIVYDDKAQTVSVPVTFNEPPDPLEYVLIHRKGKKHEALLITTAKPSVLNGALILLGLEPGTNATYKEVQPPPTLEQIEKGAEPVIVTPPQGKPIWITVRWTEEPDGDASGDEPGKGEKGKEKAKPKEKEVNAEDLLLELSTGKPVGTVAWVFLGGRMASLYKDEPQVFVADYEGNLVSTCFMHPNNHLVTMVHPRSRDEQNWWITDQAPKPGTKAKLVFHKVQPQVSKDREARLAAEAKKEKEAAGKEPPKNGK